MILMLGSDVIISMRDTSDRFDRAAGGVDAGALNVLVVCDAICEALPSTRVTFARTFAEDSLRLEATDTLRVGIFGVDSNSLRFGKTEPSVAVDFVCADSLD